MHALIEKCLFIWSFILMNFLFWRTHHDIITEGILLWFYSCCPTVSLFLTKSQTGKTSDTKYSKELLLAFLHMSMWRQAMLITNILLWVDSLCKSTVFNMHFHLPLSHQHLEVEKNEVSAILYPLLSLCKMSIVPHAEEVH